MSNCPTISVVVPVFNEEENLPELIRRTTVALEGTGESWEMVLVDDGSRDGSAGLIRAAHGADPRVKLVALSRNFGHQPAITAGVRHARGAAVILMDADLQDPPEVIPAMVGKWRGERFDVVMARRRSRADARGARGFGFRLFYPLLRRLADLPEAPDAGIFGLMDRKVVAEFNRLPERNRFIPGLRVWLGFKQGEVEYDRADRAAGEPKQTLGRLIKYAIDGMLSFSTRPLRVATWMGFLCAVVGFGTAIFFVFRRLFFNDPAFTGFTTLLVMMMFIGGIQLIAVGILGEYLGRVYEEVKQRPLYVVGETVGVEGDRGGEEG
ncbi:MAG TPA: glycosyltransferase family 2 protein [Tepidisphaeraceae bacterium]|nr:glycosyltransferase family 2 protein [Tepidisphaeraceae bacterium]